MLRSLGYANDMDPVVRLKRLTGFAHPNHVAEPSMALQELQQLEASARQRWPLEACQIVHRLGIVPASETSVAVVVSSAHRADAFAAGQWLIDTLKQQVPIWKQEQWSDGSTEWVHPTPTSDPTANMH